jgi:hypothetical protein
MEKGELKQKRGSIVARKGHTTGLKKNHLQARDTDGRFVRNIGDQVFLFGNVYIQV